MVSTYLFEQARDIVLEYLGLNKDTYVVIFCTPRRAEALKAHLKPGRYQSVSSQDIGLPLGVRALAVERSALPTGTPFQTGGGAARLVSPTWVIWAKAPDKFEAGTPAIVNVIAFAKGLRLIQHLGNDAFGNVTAEKLPAHEILYRDEREKSSGRELLDALRQTLIGRSVRVPTVEGAKRFINLVAESLRHESKQGIEPVVLNTLLEHNSNELPWRTVPGYSLIRLPVDAEGFVDFNELETLLCAYNQKGQHGKKRVRLVAVSGASNVLGVCNNLAEISRIVHRYGARLLVDAAQLVAHRTVEMEGCGIDYLALWL